MKLVLEDMPLKTFLGLFNPNEKIQVIELGDTWHPSSGFVDETILSPVENVGKILECEYDFRGLVIFKASIGLIDILYQDGIFELSGEKKGIDKVVNKIKMNNANTESPQKYLIKFIG
ncbi:MAG: hypothetical protein ABIW76_19680 [Fibrobacteria bacterium]